MNDQKTVKFSCKLTKGSNRYYIHVPAFLIKNGYLDLDREYTVYIAPAEGHDASPETVALLSDAFQKLQKKSSKPSKDQEQK